MAMDRLYKALPHFFQNILVSAFNYFAYRKRYGKKYNEYFQLFTKNKTLSLAELQANQRDRYRKFINEVLRKSQFYADLYKDIEGDIGDLNNIEHLPIVPKEIFRKHIASIHTISKSKGVVSKTGGTTGKSLEVLFTHENLQERFALIDIFRSNFGYKLGEKTAWFSGKDLITSKDIRKNRFWKTDYLNKVRYYSTFHIHEKYLKYYIANLIKFQPKYIIGFPSTILEIAKYGIKTNCIFPEGVIKAIFPTAETVTFEMRKDIEGFFHAKMYDQYASSEGAPLIFECEKGKLHLELQTGVFEVLDDNNQATNSGRLVVTTFTSIGTPLVRYDIGDLIVMENKDIKCSCGNNNPLVKEISGRIDDFVYSPEQGKVNLGNVSNTLKGTKGIMKFQVIQNKLDELVILVVTDPLVYTKQIENTFLDNWYHRVGKHMNLHLKYVEDILPEASGKYRIVKNNIKSQLI